MEGMGLKIYKYHAILHVADDIMNFGAPLECDTGSNEKGHKPTKSSAKLTQKIAERFDGQTVVRLEELYLLDLVTEELAGRPLWNYFLGHDQAEEAPKLEHTWSLGGAKFRAFWDNEMNKFRLASVGRSKRKQNFKLEQPIIDFLGGLQNLVKNHIPELIMRTQYKNDSQIFRSHTHFHGKVWRDWAVINWGKEGQLPSQFMGFVDLRALPADYEVDFEGSTYNSECLWDSSGW